MLQKFDVDIDRAAEKYELTRSKLIKYFEARKCLLAFELTDETINRVARRLSEGEEIAANSLSGYFYGVARNVFKEHLNSPEKAMLSLDLLQASNHLPEEPIEKNRSSSEKSDTERLLECLDSCVAELADKDREIILTYYKGEASEKIENRRQIAKSFGMNLNNLRIRVFRIRERLEECVRRCRNKFVSE